MLSCEGSFRTANGTFSPPRQEQAEPDGGEVVGPPLEEGVVVLAGLEQVGGIAHEARHEGLVVHRALALKQQALPVPFQDEEGAEARDPAVLLPKGRAALPGAGEDKVA